MALELR